jgi:hypothetical protein
MSAGPDDRWGTSIVGPDWLPSRSGALDDRAPEAEQPADAIRLRGLSTPGHLVVSFCVSNPLVNHELDPGYVIGFMFGLLSPGRWTAGLMTERCALAGSTNADAGAVVGWTKVVGDLRHSSGRAGFEGGGAFSCQARKRFDRSRSFASRASDVSPREQIGTDGPISSWQEHTRGWRAGRALMCAWQENRTRYVPGENIRLRLFSSTHPCLSRVGQICTSPTV